MLRGSPNPGVVGASPHAVQIQADTRRQVTLALRDGKGTLFLYQENVKQTFPLHLCIFLLSAACKAAAIQFYSCFKEFLHSSDLLENSFPFGVKNPPLYKLRVHLLHRERPPRCSCLQHLDLGL